MPYDISAMEVVNKLISVVPISGYGWHAVDADGSYKHSGLVSVPAAFTARILEFFLVEGVPTVACGAIEQADHEFNLWWVSLVPLVDDARATLTAEASSCATLICKDKPRFDPAAKPINSIKGLNPTSRPFYTGISVACARSDLITTKLGTRPA
jgi:hypothetical protein